MYEGVVTSVSTTCGETGEFSVIMSLHQELALSTYLFAPIMDVIVDELTAHIQEEVP